ncbi:chemotaxis protein CheA [Inhella crocodyli]|uniref:Chemotaxis protein CheA n=1 Tax=Inhella crocodyli TaxID=2499851 RepID=A0A437LQ76_9BURK|nr:chemotaxis protein CheA [Inhella crocodyli]RVT87559.1 chemotaxis protein CheA [Inhella crocodyli]
MNTSELIDQFVLEARDCLEQIAERLLEVERNPNDAELLNDLFRSVHTLKGNCGLFEFKPLETVVHAAEDLLDQVRSGRLAYSAHMADALLDAMDHSATLIDTIANTGQLHDADLPTSQALAQRLRAELQPAAASPAAPSPAPRSVTDRPAPWLQAVQDRPVEPGWTVLHYQPESECFFKGEDPLQLVLATPGLQWIHCATGTPWPTVDELDCYACNLQFTVASSSPQAYLQEHFRYVPEQVAWHVVAAPAAPPPTGAVPSERPDATALLQRRARQLWSDQVALLQRVDLAPATLAAARTVLLRLWSALQGGAMPAPTEVPLQAGPLLAWAQTVLAEDAHATQAPATHEAQARGASGANEDGSTGGERGPRVLKVAQDKVDRLMDLIGEMVVAKNALPYLAQRAELQFGQRELAREIKTQYAVINRIAEDMQHAIMQVRMLPVGTVFQRFGRLVRDLSRRLGKDVALVIEGEDTEADKNVIEALADPLIHILRNSLDHGIETPEVRRAAGKAAQGTLKVSAHQEGDRVILAISDDGAGIDPKRVCAKAVERGLIPADRADALTDAEATQLIFLPGFSTADSVSDLSGRGVGMDVVRSAVERVNGTVQLQSQVGRGTQLTLSLPLSMAVTHVMMIATADSRFGVPMDLIVETVRVPVDEVHRFKQSQTVVLRGRIVPLRALNELLGLELAQRPNEAGELAVLVLRWGNEQIGLVVDEFHGTSDIILKPLEGVLGQLPGFAGTALMGDGSVLMILNPKELL